MLVLTRKPQDKIQIGDNIVITVLKTKGNSVRLGIEAPTDISVLRGELAFEPPAEKAVLKKQATTKNAAMDQSTGDVVAHGRVPRSRVNTVLPQVLGQRAPLRAMLDRRNARQAVC